MTLERSPLDAVHRVLGARMVEFGGWEMPLEYPTGTIAEHLACRRDAVVFDVSHLGTVRLEEPDAFDRLQQTLTNDLHKIAAGRAQYTHLLDDDGSVLDDIIVWWHPAGDVFDVMPNASNTDRVRDAIGGRETTAQRAVLAIQGPNAVERLSTVLPGVTAVGRFRVGSVEWQNTTCTVAGTGYTGERGVEIAVPADAAATLWQAVVEAGVTPAGLGARDTLRLEAGLPLHGHELGPGITPLQAGLGWVVGWDKPAFRGRDALERERTARRRPPPRRDRHGGAPPATGRELGPLRGRDRRSGHQRQLLTGARPRDRPGLRAARSRPRRPRRDRRSRHDAPRRDRPHAVRRSLRTPASPRR